MKASLAEEEFSIVKESLRRELTLLESKANLLREEIEGFEKTHRMFSAEFVDKFENGKLGDAQDFFEWWGLLRGLKRIEEKKDKIMVVLSY